MDIANTLFHNGYVRKENLKMESDQTLVQNVQPSHALLSPQDVAGYEQFREKWKELATQAKKIRTPATEIDQKGDFAYAKWEYMEGQMDNFHPRRAVRILTSLYDSQSFTFSFDVEITDLNTGEVRPGTAVHPMVVYEAGTETLKSQRTIRQLMSNARKAALTEAIRDAMAHFGIAADLYGMTTRERPTKAQVDRWLILSGSIPVSVLPKFQERYDEQYADTCDAFLDSVAKKIEEAKTKQGETSNG
jgi:hypothetical protein